jgi:hypothetical protein
LVEEVMVKLSVAIMAHPSRLEHVNGMLEKLGRAVEVDVVVDHDELGPWPTARRCWEGTPDGASHRLILQDDLILCRDFYVGACRALRARPASPIAFYANVKKIETARAAGSSWARVSDIWGQAQCLPTPYIPKFLEWADQHEKPKLDPKCDDWLVTEFCRKHRLPVWATVPSLVEHAGASRSLIGFSNKTKVARWFIGEETSALSISWKTK